MKVPAAKVASKKVTKMVGTFLKEDSDGFQIIKATTMAGRLVEVVRNTRGLKNRQPELWRDKWEVDEVFVRGS